eukprot:jgi/Chlat1/203/Chrsp1S03037
MVGAAGLEGLAMGTGRMSQLHASTATPGAAPPPPLLLPSAGLARSKSAPAGGGSWQAATPAAGRNTSGSGQYSSLRPPLPSPSPAVTAGTSSSNSTAGRVKLYLRPGALKQYFNPAALRFSASRFQRAGGEAPFPLPFPLPLPHAKRKRVAAYDAAQQYDPLLLPSSSDDGNASGSGRDSHPCPQRKRSRRVDDAETELGKEATNTHVRSKHSESCLLLSLPAELLVRITCFLHHDELAPLLVTCRQMHEAACVAMAMHFNYLTPARDHHHHHHHHSHHHQHRLHDQRTEQQSQQPKDVSPLALLPAASISESECDSGSVRVPPAPLRRMRHFRRHNITKKLLQQRLQSTPSSPTPPDLALSTPEDALKTPASSNSDTGPLLGRVLEFNA